MMAGRTGDGMIPDPGGLLAELLADETYSDVVLAAVGEQVRSWPEPDRQRVALACDQIAWFCRDEEGPA